MTEIEALNVLKNYLEQRALETNDEELFERLQGMTRDELVKELENWKR